MKLNFNEWFYKYHRYLKNKTDYNDTKWNNMNEKLSRLINIQSELLSEQPFGVISNKYGFSRLIELFEKSNYTFQDLDDSLVETYKMSYENAMSRMLVNTHTVISHCKSTDKKVVSSDPKDSRYYIVDVPFNQFHFGDRDEIIRQYLNKLYNHRNEYYMPMEELISSEITKVLGCTFLCVTNGLICNDWGVAIDDKGFKFRIGWGLDYDVEFIIYKLDDCIIDTFNFPINNVESSFVSKDYFTNYTLYPENVNCIVNFYIPIRGFATTSVPNFGVFKKDGLHINGLQKKTLNDLENLRNTSNNVYGNCKVIVYGLKFIHELPNTYPCVNFMDMLYSHPIMTEQGLDVYTDENKQVIGMSYDVNDTIPMGTPPISVDRSADISFKNVLDCLKLKDYMMTLESTMLSIGQNINGFSPTLYYFNQNILNPIKTMLTDLKNMYKMYMIGGIITSLISFETKYIFQDLIKRLEIFVEKVSEDPNEYTARKYSLEEFYGIEYRNFVDRITKPFNHPSLNVFRNLNTDEFTRRYFDEEDKNTRFNRPISEQCFISLKYSYDEDCWLFVYPDIKHFHGIGNTFYINDGLLGNEVFKFFFMYTDTEDPSHKNIEEFDFDKVFDYDKFCDEIDSYIGYIRYWNIENHLHKLSRIMFNDDSSEYQLQVLSKVLTGKLNGEELLDIYPTDMNYEPSNASTDNVSLYTTDSERAPFALNFLFYTINMMYDEKDQLLSYFLRMLTKQKFTNRYSDIDISSVLNIDTFKVNYSIISCGDGISGTVHNGVNKPMLFYGFPNVVNMNGITPYTYTFNVYETTQFPLVDGNGCLSYDTYIDEITDYVMYDYSYDIQLVKKLMSFVMYCFDFINMVETRYTYSFNIYNQLVKCIDRFVMYGTDINRFIESNSDKFINASTWLNDITESINTVISTTAHLVSLLRSFSNSIPSNTNIYRYLNTEFLKTLQFIYKSYGFKDYASKRIKELYIHMCKINNPMNLFELDKWINGIDMSCITYLREMMSDNQNNDPKPIQSFVNFYSKLDIFVTGSTTFISGIKSIYNIISDDVFVNNIDGLMRNVCGDIIDKDSNELYAIDKFVVSTYPSYATKPAFIIVTITVPNHVGTNITKDLILIPIVDNVNGTYELTDIRQICSYAFMDGNTITPSSVSVYDADGNVIDTSFTFDITLLRVGNTSDISHDIQEVCDINDTELPFKNIHETSKTVGNMVVTINHANLNFELLSGNKFIPLTSTHEYSFDRNSLIAEPVDVVHVSNALINSLSKKNYGYHNKPEIYVKPVQVIDSTEPIGQCYYPNHRVFVKTNDEYEFVFPIIIKAVDHSQYNGFVEAIVDYNNSEWFKLNGNQFYQDNVECVVLDDNMCNFLTEFNNPGYYNYQVTKFKNNIDNDVYSLPGDPLYVQPNSDYIHTRLNWIFGLDIPNRFIDNKHKSYQYVYINSGSFIPDDSMRIFMLKHNFNTLTLPGMYPVLRDEPNDHYVHKLEQTKYTTLRDEYLVKLKNKQNEYERHVSEYETETNPNTKFKLQLQIEDDELKIKFYESFVKRLEDYIKQPESATTWYNLYAYEDAITYIDNGRAKMSHIPRRKDLVYSDKLEVRLYDWEHKCWLNPKDFTIALKTIDGSTLDNYDSYETNDVQYSLTITPTDNTFESKRVLVYFVYDKSDIYDDISNDNITCNVRFKQFVSLYESNKDTIYDHIRIRKHFDSNEVYKVTETYSNDDFSLTNGLYVKRIRPSGKYSNASTCRWCDLKVNSYTYSNFDIYVRFPLNNILQDQYMQSTTYDVTINQPIDGFTNNETITLVCLSQTFNGNVSGLLFTAKTSNSTLTIIDSSIHPIPNGTYICTVAKDPMYKSCGGIISITVETTNTDNIIDNNFKWILVQSPEYKIIPDEFILVPNNISITLPCNIELHNVYTKDTNTPLNPKTYYYDEVNEVRYPISDITNNDYSSRLNINATENPSVKKIRSNYISVCRYSTKRIPCDGLLDFTGYIPTPLSRDRYEFWVNGRCLTDKNVSIISPTSIQLHDLVSLHNFELIELVDDIDETNPVFKTGSVYMDLNGQTFSSYTLMMLSNTNIRYQSIKYRFYFNTKSPLDMYTKNKIPNPNNQDIEPDILSYLSLPTTVTSYNQLCNIPTINGVSIYHPTSIDLGLLEIKHDKILSVYDKTWAYEITTNPLFPITHKDLTSTTEYVNINIFETSTGFRIIPTGICDKFFTIYITSNPSVTIQNPTDTKKIIPMIKVGTELFIDKSLHGMWVCSTFPNTKNKQLY